MLFFSNIKIYAQIVLLIYNNVSLGQIFEYKKSQEKPGLI